MRFVLDMCASIIDTPRLWLSRLPSLAITTLTCVKMHHSPSYLSTGHMQTRAYTHSNPKHNKKRKKRKAFLQCFLQNFPSITLRLTRNYNLSSKLPFYHSDSRAATTFHQNFSLWLYDVRSALANLSENVSTPSEFLISSPSTRKEGRDGK